jgi:hypothetical protein
LAAGGTAFGLFHRACHQGPSATLLRSSERSPRQEPLNARAAA